MRFFILLCVLFSLPPFAMAQVATEQNDTPLCTKHEDCRLLTYKDCCGLETGICIGPGYDAGRFLKGMQSICKIVKLDCSKPTIRPASCKCLASKCLAVRPPGQGVMKP